ncbi:MAG: ROK family protein [Elusimicrobia bacterium]|nr:ROK family protein [Elusimicrobiota bacterium]
MIGIGVDVGGSFTKIAATDGKKILRMFETPTITAKGKNYFIKNTASAIIRMASFFEGKKFSVVVGVAGDIDYQKGVARFCPNFLQWRNVKIAGPLKKLTGLSCRVENDANMAAWGAYSFELGKKYRNTAVITLGTGIGGGIILDGKLYRGANFCAGEIGHTKIVLDGEKCNCGMRGCLEAYAGCYGIVRRAKKEGLKVSDAASLNKAADLGDPAAKKIWQDTGYYLGVATANLCLLINPDAVVFSGGISKAHRHFMPSLRRVLKEQSVKSPFRRLKIKIAKSAHLGAIGSALFALEHE